jgi:S1-C subfamily serine protease
LIMRSIPGSGATVTRVDPGSVGDRAGIRAGDVITRIAGIEAPTAGEIRRMFTASAKGQAPLLALTRDGAHRVTALEK